MLRILGDVLELFLNKLKNFYQDCKPKKNPTSCLPEPEPEPLKSISGDFRAKAWAQVY